jgi:excisionase family DNA binding protein
MREDEYATTHEIAEMLGYRVQHVRRLLHGGMLKGKKVGRDWVVVRESVDHYLASKDNFALPLDEGSRANGYGRGAEEPTAGTKGKPPTLEEIFAGGEPGLALKRFAKRIAWSNGSRPTSTTHRIYRGDARRLRQLDGESVDVVVTSPPYFNLVEYAGNRGTPGQLGDFDEYQDFLDQLDQVWRRCFDLLVPGGRLCIVVGDVCLSRRQAGRHHVLPLHADIAARCRTIGYDYLTPILWSKIANMATEVGGSARFLGKPYEPNGVIKNDVEYILLLRKPGSYRKPSIHQRALSLLDADDHRRWYRSVWTDLPGESRKAGHPAPFPAELAYRLISMFSFVGDTVLDPFWGTGSTTVAAIRAARHSVGFDIEPEYLNIGRARLAQQDAAVVPPEVEFHLDPEAADEGAGQPDRASGSEPVPPEVGLPQ